MILVIAIKNTYAVKRLVLEATKARTSLKILSVEELVKRKFNLDIKPYQALYIRNPFLNASPKFLPQIIKLAKKFNKAGKRVIDPGIISGRLGLGKRQDYEQLIKAKLPVPKTQLTFKTKNLTYPFILKWIYGFKGRHVFFIHNRHYLKDILPLHPRNQWKAQEFIRADFEYKVMTVGYKALPIVLRFKPKATGFGLDFKRHEVIFRRHSDPGFEPGEESQKKRFFVALTKAPWAPQDDAVKKVVQLAEKASKVLGRELAKVDILQAGGKFYILEVNRSPGFKSFETLTKYNVAGEFVKYLTKARKRVK